MKLFGNVTVAIDVSGGERLVGRDGLLSPASRGALEQAVWLARREGAKLHVLNSIDVEARSETLIRREFAAGADCVLRAARRRMDEIVEPLRASGLSVTSEVTFGRAPSVVLDDVARNGRDLVVVGTRERGAVARNLLGSTALQLLRRCPVAVWVARSAPSAEIGVVVAPVDVGDMAAAILRAAASIAEGAHARLLVVHALDPAYERVLRMGGLGAAEVDVASSARRNDAQETIERMVREAAPGTRRVEVRVVPGDPADVILAEAGQAHADLVVMGSVVHGLVRGVFLGSTAENVLLHLATSLLVVKPPAATA